MTETDASPRTVRVLTALLLVATFAAGAVTGGGISRWLGVHHAPPAPPPMVMGPIPSEEFGLSDDQRRRVFDILERFRPELEAVLRETYPRVRAINERLEEEVRSVLTAEQRARFDEIRAQRPPLPPAEPVHPGPLPYGGWGHRGGFGPGGPVPRGSWRPPPWGPVPGLPSAGSHPSASPPHGDLGSDALRPPAQSPAGSATVAVP